MSARRETFELLDGLRGIAAIAVVIMHTSDQYGLVYAIPHAYMAVPFFFMLSGIVIAHAYENRIMRTSSPFAFLAIRIERLYPLLLLGLAVSLGIRIGFGDGAINHEIWLMLLAAICLIPWPGSSVFPLLAPQWSLAIEIWGNLVHRLILGRLSDRNLMLLVGLGGFAMAACGVYFGGLNIGWSFDTLVGGVAIFAFCYPCGILLYRMRVQFRLPQITAPLWLVVLALLATICIPTPLLTTVNGLRDLACAILVFPLLLTAAMNERPSGFVQRISRWLGLLSYPLYIVHYPIVIKAASLLNRTGPSRIVEYISVPIIVALAIVIACLCLAIDMALRRRLKAIRGNRAIAQPAAAP
ncbi:acyltransferase family protein [Sphingomonas sp. UYP23]